MSPQLATLQSKLREIFEFDHAEDLDFGIYRILNLKREQTTLFLNELLEKYVKDAFKPFEDKTKVRILAELEELERQAATMGIKPQDSPKYQEKQKQLLSAVDTQKTENEVYAHLAEFFGRYYDSGDFISLRRYKKDVYAIPYEGEEVKLHWANADQYYIKTTEYLSNYGFVVGGKKIAFKLAQADADASANNKVSKEKERVFRLASGQTYKVLNAEDENDETKPYRFLEIYFTYAAKQSKDENQTKLLEEAFETLKANSDLIQHFPELFYPAPTEKQKNRTVLEKHLAQYTARNTRDFFIHKNLEKFLGQELDFYLKNEVMFIDDLDTEKEVDVQVYLSKVKVIKRIGLKIIAMLAQVENFQKRLWLKKKFVLQSDWCFTLDRVPENFYHDILKNQGQVKEWIRLFSISNIGRADGVIGYSEVWDDQAVLINSAQEKGFEFIKQNVTLPLDTAFFSRDFKNNLLSNFDDLDLKTNGLLVHSENFQALRLIQESFREQVKCTYIDPPYNTGDDGFVYKDNFQESSWLSLLYDRILASIPIVKKEGTFTMSIDLKEVDKSISLLDLALGEENRKNCITVKRGSVTGAKVINPGVVNVSEYVLNYSMNGQRWEPERAFREKEYDNRYGSIITNPEIHFELWTFESVLDAFSKKLGIKKSQLKKELDEKYDDQLLDFVISEANRVIRFASLDESSISEEAVELKRLSKEQPGRIFHLARGDKNDYYILNGNAILFYKDRLIKVGEKLVPGEPISDIWDDVLPNDLHNEGKVSLRKGKKPERLLSRVIEMSTKENELVLDFFVGSGTTCAVAQKLKRRWIGIEQGEYFDGITLKRMKITLQGDSSGISNEMNWKGGGAFKYLRLESYEDTLTNLAETGTLEPSTQQQALLAKSPALKDDYLLRYALDLESREPLLPQSLFDRPWDAKLSCTRDNAVIESPIDMAETFNYLLGLVVRNVRMSSAKNAEGISCPVYAVEGQTLSGQQVLVLWRNLLGADALDCLSLNTWFQKMYDLPKRTDFDVIYVNGDTLLPNVKFTQSEQPARFKVNLLESEFARLMWEGTD